MGVPVTLTDPDGNYVEISPGGGGGSVTVTNFPATQAVSGPLTNAQLTAVTGAANAAAWNGSDASATMVPILKAICAQNTSIIALLTQIQENTAST